MKQRFLLICLGALLTAGRPCGAADEAAAPVPAVAEPSPASDPALVWGFPVGEELVYSIYWGKIYVGESHAVVEWVEENGRRLLAIRVRTRTNRVLSVLYPVDDLIESLVDPDTFLPVRFTKRINEGRYHADEVTDFDHAAGQAHWKSLKNGREHSFPISSNIRDIPSLMYYLRRERFMPNETRTFDVMADEKVYSMQAMATDVEPVKLRKYGKIPSLKIEPMATFSGVFVNKGRMWMWVSTRGRAIATRISVEVPVARVHLVLQDVLGPDGDQWMKELDLPVHEEPDSKEKNS